MKKLIPIAMIESLNPYLEQYNSLYTRIEDETCTLHLVDADEFDKSDFFFKITFPNSSNRYNIKFKPANELAPVDASIEDLEINTVKGYLENWISLLNRYSKPSTFDNPARYHANNFFNEIRIEDPNAYTQPFTFEQLLLLDKVLSEVELDVNDLIESEEVDSKRQELLIVAEEIKQLREHSSSLSKNNVMKNLSKVMGKLLKLGIKYILPVYKRLKDGLLEKMTDITIEKMIQTGKDIIEATSN